MSGFRLPEYIGMPETFGVLCNGLCRAHSMSSFDATRRQTLNSRINCVFRKLIAVNRDTDQPHTAKQNLKSVRPMPTGAHFDPTNINRRLGGAVLSFLILFALPASSYSAVLCPCPKLIVGRW